MPATVHISPRMQERGIALRKYSSVEQITGLIEVAVSYVATAAGLDKIRSMFYIDAPPPVLPTAIRPVDLLTNRLYMRAHNIDISNGLAEISASYVGGVLKSRWRGYAYSESREYFTLFDTYRMEKKAVTFTYVQILNQRANLSIPELSRTDLITLVGPARRTFSDPTQTVNAQMTARQSFLEPYLLQNVTTIFSSDYLTPSVALISQQVRVED